MGAYLALKVASLLEEKGIQPLAIFVSGNPGPGVGIRRGRYLYKNEDFLRELKKIGGVPEDVFEDKELLAYYMPIWRADFEIAENNKLDNMGALRCPLFALMGSGEEFVSCIDNWRRFTLALFEYQIFIGGHFFINDCPSEIADFIRSCLKNLNT